MNPFRRLTPTGTPVGWISSLLAMLALAVLPAAAAESWLIRESPIRFTVSLKQPPTHPSAGYFLHLPDGGILPKPFPVTQVVDSAGNALQSYVLWQNPVAGTAIVFEAPKSGRVVYVYVTRGAMLNVWTPRSGLTPSAIIATYPGHATQNDAISLSRFGAVDATVHYRNQPGSKGATLALPGDRSGRPGLAAMYMLAYLATTDPGETWIAPMTFGGNIQVSIDGAALQLQKNSDKQGGTGASVNLTAGLHRLDVLGYYNAKNVAPEMLLTWRTPNTTIKELGGKRADDLPHPGTPMWETRQFHPREIVRSGECEIQGIQSRDGEPVAYFTLEPRQNYWFGDETPVLLYALQAFPAGNPESTQYTWSFSENPGVAVTGPNVSWLFTSLRDQEVTLKAVAGGKQSQSTQLFYPFTDKQTNLNNPAARAAFRDTCLKVFESYPSSKDPTAGWDSSLWKNLFRNVELTRSNGLVSYMITNRWDLLRKHLSTDQEEMLEDMFLTTIAFDDPQAALKWAVLLEKKALVTEHVVLLPGERLDLAEEQEKLLRKRERAVCLRLKGAEVLMYQLRNLDEARQWVKPLLAEKGEGGEWARIRMGDIEFLAGNLNEATQLYGDVQDRSKHTKTPAEIAAALKAEGATKDSGKEKKQGKKAKSPAIIPAPPPHVAAWKLSAIRDVAAAESVRNLLDQGFMWEAFQALRSWEREFPLSKISSDYLLLEGRLSMSLGNYVRCRALLQAYCDQVDASNYVGDALEMIVQCMTAMKEPPEAIAKYRAAVKKRLEFH